MLSNEHDYGLTAGRASGGDWDDDESQAQQPRSQFFGMTRGICRFGVLAAGSLAMVLLVRQVPAIAPVGWLALGCGLSGVAIYCTFSINAQMQLNILIVTVVLLFGLLCGTWDAIRALFVDAPFVWQGLAVLVAFAAVVSLDLLRRQRRHE